MRQGAPRIKRTLNENSKSGPKVKSLTAGSGEANLHDDSPISSARGIQAVNVLESLEPESRDPHPLEFERKLSDACSLAESIDESPDLPSRRKSHQQEFERNASDACSLAESVHESLDQPLRRKSQSEELAESLKAMEVPDDPNAVVKRVSSSALADVKPSLAHSNDTHEHKVTSETPAVTLPTVAKSAASRNNAERSPPNSARSALPSVNKTAGSRSNIQPSPPNSARPPVSARSVPRGPRAKAQTPREPAVSQTPSAPSAVSREAPQKRAQSERPIRKRASTIGGRLAQLVSEVSTHLKSFREPPDPNGYLQENAQLELFLEEMRWLMSEQEEKSGVGQLAFGKQNSTGSNVDKEQMNLRDQLRRLQLEHSYLLQRVQNANPAIQEHTAELKVVEAEIASEKNRQRQLKAESRQRDQGLGRYIIDGEPIDGATRAMQDIDRLNADLGVWKVKNNSLQKQVQEAVQIMRNSQAKRDRLVHKAEELEAVLNSTEFIARQSEQQKVQERRKAEELSLQKLLTGLQEERQSALTNHRRHKRDGNRELLQLVERCKALEEREKESAAVRRLLQREWLHQGMHEQDPVIDSSLADRGGSESEFPNKSARQYQPASPKAKQTPKAFPASPSSRAGFQEPEPMNGARRSSKQSEFSNRRGSIESETSNRSARQSQAASPKAKQTPTRQQSFHELETKTDSKAAGRKNSTESGLSNRSTRQSQSASPKATQTASAPPSQPQTNRRPSRGAAVISELSEHGRQSPMVETPKSASSGNRPRQSLSRRPSKSSNRGSGEHRADTNASPVEHAKHSLPSQDDASRLNELRDQTGQDLLSASGNGGLEVAVTDFLQEDKASDLEAANLSVDEQAKLKRLSLCD